eukprot:12570767-Ditylum_brightwellii.AAC.1
MKEHHPEEGSLAVVLHQQVMPTLHHQKIQIGKGAHVKSMRQQLYHILTIEQIEQIPKDIGNTYNFYGTVVVGSSLKGWDVSYNFLPHNNKVVKKSQQNTIRCGKNK